MVSLAEYLVSDSIESYKTDSIDGQDVEALFDTPELETRLAYRRSVATDLRALLEEWTRGFVPLNTIEETLSELIEARATGTVERVTAEVGADEALAALEPDDTTASGGPRSRRRSAGAKGCSSPCRAASFATCCSRTRTRVCGWAPSWPHARSPGHGRAVHAGDSPAGAQVAGRRRPGARGHRPAAGAARPRGRPDRRRHARHSGAECRGLPDPRQRGRAAGVRRPRRAGAWPGRARQRPGACIRTGRRSRAACR